MPTTPLKIEYLSSCREDGSLVEPEVHARCNIEIEDGCSHNETDDEDGLRKRIEDFIAKVNREWREENLGENATR
ncbi:hypothetical protein SAY86_025355 [Trapa natans]|uniref:Uncharacterized protein n=1 Tax=Trapa natans TaxID=22666 RepID=A0AAN7MQV9_TRANT|nr:hypothetical protein SAY86_025355 [Trapa natans]